MRYPKWAGLLLLLALTLAMGTACGGAEVATPTFRGGPRVTFEREAVLLGRVPLDRMISYEFRFHNVGDAPLTVRKTTVEVLEGC